jgi:glutathione-regulated potassium-efflux system ancillary protein KefG
MNFMPPYVVHGTHRITTENLVSYNQEYKKLIEYLRDEPIEIDKIVKLNYLNEYIKHKVDQ